MRISVSISWLIVLIVVVGFWQTSYSYAAQTNKSISDLLSNSIDRLSSELESDEGLLGNFSEASFDKYVFKPDNPAYPYLKVANTENIGLAAIGPKVRVKGKVSNNGRSVTVESFSLGSGLVSNHVRSLARISESDAALERSLANFASTAPLGGVQSSASDIAIPEFRDLDKQSLNSLDQNVFFGLLKAYQASQELVDRLQSRSLPRQANVDEKSLLTDTQIRREDMGNIKEIQDAYQAAVESGDLDDANRIALMWRNTREYVFSSYPDDPQFKALYGSDDRYSPWTYDLIRLKSLSVVAIAQRGSTKPHCSGFLIAENLIMTAGHCFSTSPPLEPSDTEVWFGFAQKPDLSLQQPVKRQLEAIPVAPTLDKWEKLAQGLFDSSLYDYAIVKLKSPSGEDPLIPKIALTDGRNVTPEPLKLCSQPPNRGDALYVVGFSEGGPKTVHDNARVELPFRILATELSNLRLNVDSDFQGSPDHVEVMEQFDLSYKSDDALNTGQLFEWKYLFDIREHGQPSMGIVADTFHGNSGGPVYVRGKKQCVAGVLTKGMEDTGKRRIASWKVHERVLPMLAIKLDLASNESTKPLVESGLLNFD